jgi:predicted alpha-1,2-mannosidase
MKKVLFVFAAALCAACSAATPETQSPADFVNPLMGTESSFELSAGNTYPAIARPWGMNFWTPQTGKMGNGWQYTYTAHKICGFKQTHQPSPWINDYGQFSLMPITGALQVAESRRASWFSHKSEIATPYYYKVYLADHDVVAEFTPTERAAMFRFTFPESNRAFVVVDAFDKGSYVKVLPDKRQVVGYSTRNSGGVPDGFKNYFIIEFDKEFSAVTVFADTVLHADALEMDAPHAGAVVGFNTRKGEAVHARVASSFISAEQAAQNLKEADGDFDALTAQGKQAWNNALSRIEIQGGTTDQYRTFYSCLYRSLLFPRKFYEITAAGDTVHYSPYNGKVLPGTMYTDMGFWDVFRALFPLLNLVYPDVNIEMQEGYLNAYRESGFFPEWASPGHRGCMVGNNSASILADAYVKGVRVRDTAALWAGVVHGAHNVHPKVSSTGRRGHEYYDSLGYVPCDVDINESAARTLEYAYDDWCIAVLARLLQRPQAEIDYYTARAQNYRKVFDSTSNLMRGRRADGAFDTPFSPFKWGGAFTEGNSWHYTWSVFHDPQGLIDLMGGHEPFVRMLDSVFVVPPVFDDSYYGFPIHEIREMTVMNMGNYAHGNQPIQHMIYLYNYAGAAWKGQYWLREVMNRMYTPAPDGYCGDEDNGQTSAWYVFSALGFYPVCPASNEYAIGAPLFKKATLHLPNGKTATINAPSNSADNRYIRSIKVNGKRHQQHYFTHEQLLSGASIDIEMGNTP